MTRYIHPNTDLEVSAPDVVGTITGYRNFHYNRSDGCLWSPIMGGRWVVPNKTAKCLRHFDHAAPDVDCWCGIYAHNSLNNAMGFKHGDIIAKIEMWGKVIEGTFGYRAEHVKIVKLYIAPLKSVPKSHRRQLAWRYDCVVEKLTLKMVRLRRV